MGKEDKNLAELETLLEQLELQIFAKLNGIISGNIKTILPKYLATARLNGQLNAIFTIKSFVEYLKMK